MALFFKQDSRDNYSYTIDPSRVVESTIPNKISKMFTNGTPERVQESSLECEMCHKVPIYGLTARQCTSCEALFCEPCLI